MALDERIQVMKQKREDAAGLRYGNGGDYSCGVA